MFSGLQSFLSNGGLSNVLENSGFSMEMLQNLMQNQGQQQQQEEEDPTLPMLMSMMQGTAARRQGGLGGLGGMPQRNPAFNVRSMFGVPQ
jgi:hypothetical protein